MSYTNIIMFTVKGKKTTIVEQVYEYERICWLLLQPAYPLDLHMEHFNRRLKTVIRSMGANVSPKRVEGAGKAIHQVQKVCQVFEKHIARRVRSDTHPYPSFGKDFSTLLKCVIEEQVFKKVPDRFYPSFSFNKSIFAITNKGIEQEN